MKKKKSAQDILIEGIKNMPPIHVAYLMQRLQHDTKEPIDESTARACSIVAVEKIIEALKLNEWQNKKEIFYYEEVMRQIIFYI